MRSLRWSIGGSIVVVAALAATTGVAPARVAAPRSLPPAALELISADPLGEPAGGYGVADLSGDASKVVFRSTSTTLGVVAPPQEEFGVYLRDRPGASTSLVDTVHGATAYGLTEGVVMSDDGSAVAILTDLRLDAADVNADYDVYHIDLGTGDATLVSVDMGGGSANDTSWASDECDRLHCLPSISADGRQVAFVSRASDLVPGDDNSKFDAFVRDLDAGTTELLSVAPDGGVPNGHTKSVVLSGDADRAVLSTQATDLVASFFGGVVVRDRTAATTTVLTSPVPAASVARAGTLSLDGRRAAFAASTSVVGPWSLVTVDLETDQRAVLPVLDGVFEPRDPPELSADGRFLAFTTGEDLVPQDTDGVFDVYVADLAAGELVVGARDGAEAPLIGTLGPGFGFSSDGTTILFSTNQALPSASMAFTYDAFVRRWDTQRCRLVLADVPSTSVFCVDIGWLVDSGIASGYADGRYHTTAPVTRQAMSAFLHRFSGAPAGPFTDPGFTDVLAGHPFLHEISWMVDEGLAGGFADGGFHPTAPMSRQALAAFLYRLAGSPDGASPTCSAAPFPDVAVDHPFCAEITWLAGSGITSGYADGTFRPGVAISRQAMAAMLHRADGLLPAP